jgi:hypothetical protein
MNLTGQLIWRHARLPQTHIAPAPFEQLRLRVVKQDFYSPKDSESLFELRFALRNDVDVFQDHNLIRWFIETSTHRSPEAQMPTSKILH